MNFATIVKVETAITKTVKVILEASEADLVHRLLDAHCLCDFLSTGFSVDESLALLEMKMKLGMAS
jgi:hypothetical protein